MQRLLAHEHHLRDACVLPDAVGLLAQTWPQLSAADRDAATGFVVRAVSNFDPLQTDDVLEVLLLAPALLPDVADPSGQVWPPQRGQSRRESPTPHPPPGRRWSSLPWPDTGG